MNSNLSELVKKVNFVLNVRDMKAKNEIDEYPIIPSAVQEADVIKDLVFKFLKKNFPGCRIRVNAHSITLRLDGHIHRKASKIRKIWGEEHEWRQFFERNHQNIYREIRNNQETFRPHYTNHVEVRIQDNKKYLYVPFKPNRIYNYAQSGLQDMLSYMRAEVQRDQQIAGIYDDFIRLMEAEIERKERERREKYERAINEYVNGLKQRLIRPISELEESGDEGKVILAKKLREWARENGKQPIYAVEPNYASVVPVGTNVRILSRQGSKEEGWFALPMFEGYTIPEGYIVQEGWGKITKHDETAKRSRDGEAPLVIQDYIHVAFDYDLWKHLMPEGYSELLEVTEEMTKEVAPEVAAAQEKKREEEEARRKAEQERLAEEARIRAEEEARQRVEEERLRVLEEAERRAEEERRARERAERERREREERERLELEARQAAEAQRELTERLRQQMMGRAQAALQQAAETPAEEVRADAPDIDVDLGTGLPEGRIVELTGGTQGEVTTRRPGIYTRLVNDQQIYVLVVNGTEERTYVRRGNAINAYVNAFDAQPTEIKHYDRPDEVAEII